MNNWQPMNTAPKDRRILLQRQKREVGIGQWDEQWHHAKPRPYWGDERPYYGVKENRESEPTGWMEMPK